MPFLHFGYKLAPMDSQVVHNGEVAEWFKATGPSNQRFTKKINKMLGSGEVGEWFKATVLKTVIR